MAAADAVDENVEYSQRLAYSFGFVAGKASVENGDVAGAAVEMAAALEVPAPAPEIFQEVHNDCSFWVLLHQVAETFGHFHVFFAEEAAGEDLYPQQGVYFLLDCDCDCDSYVQEVQVVQEAQVVQICH